MFLIWTNSTGSGLGDRLIDILIMSTFAKILNRKLKFNYKNQSFGNSLQELLRPEYRKYDYLYENFIKYINLPENVLCFNENEPINISNNDMIFNEYLGGVYSPITFYKNYVKNYCTLDFFISSFFQQYSEIRFNLDINLSFSKIISVHLRRTDKVSNYTDQHHGIKIEELDYLNNLTHNLINYFIKNGYTNFYFCSDDSNVLKEYINFYKDKINIINESIFKNIDQENLEEKIKRVYIDLFIMSKSEYILMSQKHSSFSLFASMINQTKLIYLFENDLIEKNDYTYFSHIINYKDILFNKNI